MHTGQKFDYLACEVCGSLRVEDTDSKTEDIIEVEKERLARTS